MKNQFSFLREVSLKFPALFLLLALFVSSSLHSQSPLGIPYQAVMRNADGSVLASSAVNLTFMIHDGTADGTVVYQESHSLTSNAHGLVSCVVGNGTASQGTFASINWSSGAKFLQVMMNGNNLGTHQMLSVPYALYSGNTHVSVSATGDTLTIGRQSVIVPGVSAANPTNNGGLGSQVLVGNTICANEYISVTGCGGQTSLTYDGRTYDLVEIGGQCWFADNLATDQYRNGDIIADGDTTYYIDEASGQSEFIAAWPANGNRHIGGFAIYQNSEFIDSIYGKLYNYYAVIDQRGLCPYGWHVPTDCEWMYMEGEIGMSIEDQQLIAVRACNAWVITSLGSNSTGLSINKAGWFDDTDFYNLDNTAYYWTSSMDGDNWVFSWIRDHYSLDSINRYAVPKNHGYSVRCIRD